MIFLSTLSLRRATFAHRLFFVLPRIFLSTLSLRRATRYVSHMGSFAKISIHALLAESDQPLPAQFSLRRISIHALLAESDHIFSDSVIIFLVFLSTLSLRRATPAGAVFRYSSTHFYPRSPCGERPWLTSFPSSPTRISIHALLAESDYLGAWKSCNVRYFYPRSPCGERLDY